MHKQFHTLHTSNTTEKGLRIEYIFENGANINHALGLKSLLVLKAHTVFGGSSRMQPA